MPFFSGFKDEFEKLARSSKALKALAGIGLGTAGGAAGYVAGKKAKDTERDTLENKNIVAAYEMGAKAGATQVINNIRKAMLQRQQEGAAHRAQQQAARQQRQRTNRAQAATQRQGQALRRKTRQAEARLSLEGD
jgi:hypothetical protein